MSSSHHVSVCEEDRKLASYCKMKFEFQNLDIRFRKAKVSFLVVKSVKCKRGIKFLILSV